jgi:hypothetical protein
MFWVDVQFESRELLSGRWSLVAAPHRHCLLLPLDLRLKLQ